MCADSGATDSTGIKFQIFVSGKSLNYFIGLKILLFSTVKLEFLFYEAAS